MKLGIDSGGSHVGMGLISEDLKLIQTQHIDFQKKEKIQLEEIQEMIRQTIHKMLAEQNLTKEEISQIGVAAPGVPKEDRIERIVNLRFENLSVSELLPDFQGKKISIHNDGKCAAVAEKKMGSLIDEKDCVFLCLGTGIGAGVFLDGNLLKPRKSTRI